MSKPLGYKYFRENKEKILGGKKSKSKYNNQRPEIDGIKFHSGKEADYYGELKLRVKGGDLDFFLMQVPFILPGPVKYMLDFLEFKQHDSGLWSIKCIDTKGVKTRSFVDKKKQVERLYPLIEIICK